MLRIIILCLAVLAINSTRAQRHLETVRSPAGSEQQNTAYNGKILIGVQGESFLLSYDDVSFTSHAFPIVGGSQLRFYNNNNPLTVFQSAVFLRLTTSTGTASYLYRFNGTSFSRIIIPGNMIANCVVYGTYLYFLSNVSGTIKLYRYNGSVSEVPASLPNAGGHKLHVAGGYLYITGYAISGSTANFIRRYNGSGFLTLPYSGPGTNVSGIYHVPGTVRAYFTSHERILYYDGSTVRQVFYNVGEPVFARMWRNKLYFTTGVGSAPGRTTHLYRLNGTALTAVTMPGAV
ncbi:MAG TPA: hypothetical protein VD996_13450, partial [Chitinophagaceae bacterium]|nr:hypothetical protein [Chitinophagaceae bacterium]